MSYSGISKKGLEERCASRKRDARLLRSARIVRGHVTRQPERAVALAYFAGLPTSVLLEAKEATSGALVAMTARNRIAAARRERIPWTQEELAMLSLPLSAAALSRQMPGRSVWAISFKRRQLGVKGKRGAVPKNLTDYPGVDWTLPVSQLVKQLGLAFVTARRLKSLALARHAGSLSTR